MPACLVAEFAGNLHRSFSPLRASEMTFDARLAVTGAANRHLPTCTGRDHRRHEPNCGLYRFDHTQGPDSGESPRQIVTFRDAPPVRTMLGQTVGCLATGLWERRRR